MYKEIPVVVVAAMSKERHVIGGKNELLWHIPDDLKRFKELTLGHPIIMGRKTFESIVDILGKPLPKRPNIVVTRNPDYTYEGVEVAGSLEEALLLAKAHDPSEIHIGGGGDLYAQALPYVDRLHLTFVDDEPDGDVFFPDFADDFEVTAHHEAREHDGLRYEWVDYVRKEEAQSNIHM